MDLVTEMEIRKQVRVTTFRTHGRMNLRDNGVDLYHFPTGAHVRVADSERYIDNLDAAWNALFDLLGVE